MIKLMLGQPE